MKAKLHLTSDSLKVNKGDCFTVTWGSETPESLYLIVEREKANCQRKGQSQRQTEIPNMEREDAGKNQRFESAVCICMVCNEDLAENCVHHRLGAPVSASNSIDS